MVWKVALVCALLAVPVAVVGDDLYGGADPVERRPVLVVDDGGPPGLEPQVTLGPAPRDPEEGEDEPDDAEEDDDDVTVVRPLADDPDDPDDDLDDLDDPDDDPDDPDDESEDADDRDDDGAR